MPLDDDPSWRMLLTNVRGVLMSDQWAAPPAAGRALSRGPATARPSPSGLGPFGSDRSAKNIGGVRYARFHDVNNQDWSHRLAYTHHRGNPALQHHRPGQHSAEFGECPYRHGADLRCAPPLAPAWPSRLGGGLTNCASAR